MNSFAVGSHEPMSSARSQNVVKTLQARALLLRCSARNFASAQQKNLLAMAKGTTDGLMVIYASL